MGDFWLGRGVLVTGGAGFIGSHLVRRLVQRGAAVRVVDNLSRGTPVPGPGVEFWARDLRDPAACRDACRGTEVVFHLAARVGSMQYYRARPGEVLRHNLLVDTLVLEAALAEGVRRFLYASSAHVYPQARQRTPDAPPLREEEALPADPLLSYGWAKVLGEQALAEAVREGGRMGAVILRVAGAYGEGQDMDLDRGSAIPVLSRRAVEYPERAPYVVRGTGEETRSYCYVGDVVSALLAGVEAVEERVLLGPLNVGSEEMVRIADLAALIRHLSGKGFDIVFDASEATPLRGQRVDCARGRALLGWTPEVSLEEGLQRVLADVRARLAAGRGREPNEDPLS